MTGFRDVIPRETPHADVRAYGAIGDGSTDDTTAFQNAIDHVDSLGGGVVFVPEGTWIVSNIQMQLATVLRGAGWSTVIKQKASSYTLDDSGTSSGSNSTSTLNDTSKSWTTNEHLYKTLVITSGALSGEQRVIVSNTATQLTVGQESGIGSDVWGSTPGAVTYEIRDPTYLIETADDTDGWWSVENLRIDGNKANQGSINAGIYVSGNYSEYNTENFHILRNLLIQSVSGWGVVIGGLTSKAAVAAGTGPREGLIDNVAFHGCGRHSIWTWSGGGTDWSLTNLVSASTGLSGFVCNGSGYKWMNCKSFGAGQDEISNQGHGFLVTTEIKGYQLFAQENWSNGVHLSTADKSMIYCTADANQGDGVHLFDTDNCLINAECAAGGSPLLYTQDKAIGASGTNTNNIILLVSDGNHATIELQGNLNVDTTETHNFIFLNRSQEIHRIHHGTLWSKNGDGSETKETLNIGPNLDVSSTHPYWTFVVDSGTSNKAVLYQSFDGTNTYRYIQSNHHLKQVKLGEDGVVLPALATFTDAQRPAAGTAGRIIFNTTDGQLNIDDGTNWTLPDGTTT